MSFRRFVLAVAAFALLAAAAPPALADDDVCQTAEVARKIEAKTAELRAAEAKINKLRALREADIANRDAVVAREPSAATKIANWDAVVAKDEAELTKAVDAAVKLRGDIARLKALPPCPGAGAKGKDEPAAPRRTCRTPQDDAAAQRMEAEALNADRRKKALADEGIPIRDALFNYEAAAKKAGGFIRPESELRKRLEEIIEEVSALGKAAAALRAEAAALKALPRCTEGAKCPAAGPLQGGASDGPAALMTCRPVRVPAPDGAGLGGTYQGCLAKSFRKQPYRSSPASPRTMGS